VNAEENQPQKSSGGRPPRAPDQHQSKRRKLVSTGSSPNRSQVEKSKEVEELEELEVLEEPAERGGADKGKLMYACPFSEARDGVIYICKWPPHADRRSVLILEFISFADEQLQNHLRGIRLLDIGEGQTNSETGHNSYHREHDPLWDPPDVTALFRPRPKLSKEERDLGRKEYHKQYYRKSKAERERLKVSLDNGEITRREYDDAIAKCNFGWYKTRSDAKEAFNELWTTREHMRNAHRLGEDPSKNPLALEWPTVPSEEAYLEMICQMSDVVDLARTDDPTTPEVQIHIKARLSQDNDFLPPFEECGWISPDTKQSLAQVFNSSCDLIDAKVNSMNRQAMRRFLLTWEDKRNQFILAQAGGFDGSTPAFAFRMLLAEAYREV
jgi:hypothetical protein